MFLNGGEDSIQRISVAMCTHNGGRYLQEQLESIALQSRLPLELIVCDDQSTDDTTLILNRFKAEAPFAVKVIRNSRRLGSTRNFDQAIGLSARRTGCIVRSGRSMGTVEAGAAVGSVARGPIFRRSVF